MPETPIWLPASLLVLGLLLCALSGLLVLPRVAVLQAALSGAAMQLGQRDNAAAEKDHQIEAQTKATATMRDLLEKANRALSKTQITMADQEIRLRRSREMIAALQAAPLPALPASPAPTPPVAEPSDPYARMEGLLSSPKTVRP